MSWAKVDDQLHGHRKAKLAWKRHPRALGLHLLALSYCAGHLTDGLVDVEFVEEKVPVARERTAVTAALVDAGLWTVVEDGWRIHDWLEYNPSRTDILEKRRADAERKARRRAAESGQSPNGRAAESGGPRAGAPAGASRPVPSQPLPPLPPRGKKQRDLLRYEGKLAEFTAQHFPGVDPGYVAHYESMLRASGREPTVEALRPLVERYGTVEAPTT